jgi:hypothetical protein
MWTNEQSIETAATPKAIWRLWSDVPGWPEWNGDIEHIEISGRVELLGGDHTGSSAGWRSAARQPTP